MSPTLVLELPMPDHRLSINGARRTHPAVLRQIKRAHKEAARLAALALIPPHERPAFPAGARIRVTVDVERRRGGRRWDNSGIIEAMKPYMDGFEESGALYANDQQLDWVAVTWDERPTGRGVVTLTFTSAPAFP
ncbi:MAG TPA: hypothetical protein VFL91_27055 [Thermomicrobiales bacterium]|nr:hypothetical protein [Thermomicrobiales bacterium]